MMATTTTAQTTLGQQTITFMNCIDCEDYYEPEVNTIDMVGLILSADTIYDKFDYYEIHSNFYNEFRNCKLPGSITIFLDPDDSDILSIVIRKDSEENTKAMYLLTEHGWLQSVDMQDFYFFDRLLYLFRYQADQPILIRKKPLR